MRRKRSVAQRSAAKRNLRRARAAKKVYAKVGGMMMARRRRSMGMRRYGGFSFAGIPSMLFGAHKFLQSERPVSAIKGFLDRNKISLPKNPLTNALGKIGDFAINTLGYGYRRRMRRRRGGASRMRVRSYYRRR